MKPIYNKINLIIIIIISVLQISGCSNNNDIWIVKEKLEEPIIIDFVTYWDEETPRGRLIKQLVNNYNLYRDDEIIVNLRTIFTIEDYKSELKTLVATNLVPDIFILEQNEDDLSIELSGKLMDFSSFLNEEEWLKKDVEYLEEGYIEDKLLSLCFEFPTIRLFYHKDILEDGFFQMPDSTTPILNLFDKLSNSEEYPIMVDYLEQGRSAIDFFYYLISQNKDFDTDSKADWEEALRLWTNFSQKLDVIESSNSYETIMNWMDKKAICYIDDSSLFSRVSLGENIDSLILTDAGGKALRSSPIGFAAAKQNNKVKEKEVLLFLEYLISSSDFINKSKPKNQNEYITFNLHQESVLKSRVLNPIKQETVTNLLKSIITNQKDVESVAAELVKLYKQD